MTATALGAGDDGRTFVMPTPGGHTPDPGHAQRAPQAPAGEGVRAGSTPLLRAANPVLNLVHEVRTLVHNAEPDKLRQHLAEEIRRFEATARAMGVGNDEVLAARYCLCTVLDETAAKTPWGGGGSWSRNSLLVTFHNETWGGEKFFRLLSRLAQSPARHVDLLELMYYCICLGFEGRYSILSNGKVELETLRRRLLELIVSQRDRAERRLSPRWEGVSGERVRAWRAIPVWVAAVAVLCVGLGVYSLYAFLLAERSTPAFVQIAGIELPGVVEAVRPAQPPPGLARFLEEEIRLGLVSVDDAAGHSRVTLKGDGLFASGSVDIRGEYLAVVDRVAAALAEVPGRVLVEGHTDSVPIRSLRFPSNWELSRARAETVGTRIRDRVADGRTIDIQGRGESRPIAGNDTAEGRAVNRRVEITLYPAASAAMESP